MVAVFDFLKPLDRNGVEYEPSLETDNALIRCAKPLVFGRAHTITLSLCYLDHLLTLIFD